MAHLNTVGKPNILVFGAGAVGTTLAAYLMAARQSVRLLIRERHTAEFQAASQLTVDRIVGGESLRVPKPELFTKLDLTGIDFLLICVKHAALDGVIAQLPSTLPPGLTLVSTLNGISAMPRLRRCYRADQVSNVTVM